MCVSIKIMSNDGILLCLMRLIFLKKIKNNNNNKEYTSYSCFVFAICRLTEKNLWRHSFMILLKILQIKYSNCNYRTALKK